MDKKGEILMKDTLNKNLWIVALALCLLSALSYKAMEAEKCIEADFRSFKVGDCVDQH